MKTTLSVNRMGELLGGRHRLSRDHAFAASLLLHPPIVSAVPSSQTAKMAGTETASKGRGS